MPGMGYRLLLLGSLTVLPWLSAKAAQDTSGGLVLDQTTVTARRREEDPQDVPIPINVLYGDQLDEAGLHRLQDIQQRVPGLVATMPVMPVSACAALARPPTTMVWKAASAPTSMAFTRHARAWPSAS
ncbi:hypothetical protein [Pseudomonas sp. D1-2]|uniref:hypothetical protein n=1 Tax=Pseudomonas sp. D1-2 TaxID=2817386 RepID=UPI003DA92E41